MRVSILGCGWVGLALGRALAARGHTVTGSVTQTSKLEALGAAGIGALRLELSPTLEGDPADFFRTDVLVLTLPPKRRSEGVRARYPAQIGEVLRHTPDGTRLLFTSSTSVYADGTLGTRGRTVTEADAGGDLGESGAAILEAERSLRGRGATILRLAGLYGYDRQPGRRLSAREVTGGDARVNLVHRDDVVAASLKVIDMDLWGETFNVCAPEHPTRRAVYTRQAERGGFAPPHFVPPHEAPFKRVSSDKLMGIGYRFLHPDPLAEAP